MATSEQQNPTNRFADQARSLAKLVGAGAEVLVTTHTSPDGDAIASLLAASQIVQLLGGQPTAVLESVIPERFRFLPGAEQIRAVASCAGQRWKMVLVVDCSTLSRIGAAESLLADDAQVLNVDHHAGNDGFGTLNIVIPSAASTAEVLYDMSMVLQLGISASLAQLLYTGILTDTGSFRFSNTSPRVLEIAANLAQLGADPSAIAEAVYAHNSATGMRLLGQALCSLEFAARGQVASMVVSGEDGRAETEDLADYPLTIKDVKAAALFRVENGRCRASLRARGNLNVAQIAKRFGGGGHPCAAGFTHQGRLDEIFTPVITALCQEVELRAASNYNPE